MEPARESQTAMRRAPLQQRLKANLRRYLFRLDVCFTVLYYIFLSIVFIITITLTRTQISDPIRDNWHSLHQARIVVMGHRLSTTFTNYFSYGATFISREQHELLGQDADGLLPTLCSPLYGLPFAATIRLFSAGSSQVDALAACVRFLEAADASVSLAGFVSHNRTIDGVYYVNSTTHQLQEPLRVAMPWPDEFRNASLLIDKIVHKPSFTVAERVFNGTATEVDRSALWGSPAGLPHLLEMTVPAKLLYPDGGVPAGRDPYLFADMIVDVTTLLDYEYRLQPFDITTMILDRDSLHLSAPVVLANNWKQATVNDSTAMFLPPAATLDYLTVRSISDPLMRAALKHVDLAALQQRGYNQSADFTYRGAWATVTAISFTPSSGPTLPIVYVSSQRSITPGYLNIMHAFYSAAVGVLLLLTALFWCFVHRYLSVPLERVAAMLNDSVDAGARATRDAQPPDATFQLSEVRTLMRASNAAVARVRQIDAFVPEARRQQLQRARDPADAAAAAAAAVDEAEAAAAGGACSSAGELTEQVMTVVCLRIRRAEVAAAAVAQPAQRTVTVATGGSSSRRVRAGRGGNVLAAPAVCGDSSAPLFSRAALADFVTAAHTLARIHRGSVHRIAPDSCVFHFGRAARTHLFSAAAAAAAAALADHRGGRELAPEEQLNAAMVRREGVRCARQDAMDALRFTLELRRWLDHYRAEQLPDVRALVDTGRFACGQYRPCGSEHTMSVAFGRDADRELGHVAALIGARIMMTEETSSRVRAGVRRGMCSTVEPGVRQLPVEALRTGRVGLDANVVILYEVLPGPVVGDAAWQRYSRCCFDGFAMMLRGDYAGALCAYENVMAVADLEPGLMPPTLRREAARSSATGGAVSTQVARLMRECQRRIARGITTGYYRERIVPLGIDAVLGDTLTTRAQQQRTQVEELDLSLRSDMFRSSSQRSILPSASVATVPPGQCAVRRQSSSRGPAKPQEDEDDLEELSKEGLPQRIIDNNGMRWYLPREEQRQRHYGRQLRIPTTLVLGRAGALVNLFSRDLRRKGNEAEVSALEVDEGVADAPLDAMAPTQEEQSLAGEHIAARQVEDARELFEAYRRVRHPNIICPFAYSLSMEGKMSSLWELVPGGTLRSIYAHFPLIRPVTAVRFNICVVVALRHLHALGIVHGAVSLDAVVVDSNGLGRLVMTPRCFPRFRDVVVVPSTCYISPAMAAGHEPTPACDIFCFGLLCLEAITRRPAWRWAACVEGLPECTEAALAALMAAGGQAFRDAVVHGRVVPASERVNAPPFSDRYEGLALEAMHRVLHYDPSKRPSALELCEVSRRMLLARGFEVNKAVSESRK